MKELEDEDRIAFRYCNGNGETAEEANPNGSLDHIAGILNKERTILGMMPHPENATQYWQENRSGFPLFESIAEALG